MTVEVSLRCYDISHGMLTPIASMMKLDVKAIWHTGVLVHGIETFWSGGIERHTPAAVESRYGTRPEQVLSLGHTDKSPAEVEAFVHAHQDKFTEDTYDLLHNNCNHFSDVFAQFLLGSDTSVVPHHILNQHEVIREHPNGAMILNMLEGLSGKIQNPFQSTADASTGRIPAGVTGLFESLAGERAQSIPNYAPRTLSNGQMNSSQVEPGSEISDARIRSLFRECCKYPESTKAGIQTIAVVTDKIVSHASQPKYREIQRDSKKIAGVISCKQTRELFFALGFEEKEKSYCFTREISKASLMELKQVCLACKYWTERESVTVAPSTSAALATIPAPVNDIASIEAMLGGMGPNQDFMAAMAGGGGDPSELLSGFLGGNNDTGDGMTPAMEDLLSATMQSLDTEALLKNIDMSAMMESLRGMPMFDELLETAQKITVPGTTQPQAPNAHSVNQPPVVIDVPEIPAASSTEDIMSQLGPSIGLDGLNIGEFLSHPAVQSLTASPEFRQMSQNIARQVGVTEDIDFSGMMDAFKTVGGGIMPDGSAQVSMPSSAFSDEYSNQLEELEKHGFLEREKNIRALRKASGDVEQAILYLSYDDVDA